MPKEAVYLKENEGGQVAKIGVYDPSLPGTENKMRPCAEGFAELGVPALERCARAEGEWVTIDEIGYLETENAQYCSAIRSLASQKRIAAAVRKQELPFLRELLAREDAFVVDLDAPFGSSACVIMASGLGTRFGGNKLTANFCGEALICRVFAATEGIFAKRVVVTRHADVAALCRERGIDCVLHDLPHRSDTVRLGLEAIGEADCCMFCQGDQPLLRRETIAAMAICAKAEPGFIRRASFRGTPGSPVLFPGWAFDELKHLPEGKGGGALIKTYPDRVQTLEVSGAYELSDADTPEDLRLLAHIYSEQKEG